MRSAALRASLSALLLAALWGLAPLYAQDDVGSPPLDVRSGALEVDGASGEAVFTEGVEARRGEWLLTCPRLVVRYEEGAFVEALAEGPVVLSGPRLVAEAEGARLTEDADVVELTGEVVVRRGESVLRGEGARVVLSEQRVEMRSVRGRIRLDELGAEPGASP